MFKIFAALVNFLIQDHDMKSLFKQVSLKFEWEFSAVIINTFLANDLNKVLVG